MDILDRTWLWRAVHALIRGRDARPAQMPMDSTAAPLPHGTDWVWRPEIWRMPLATPDMSPVLSTAVLGAEARVFHDCPRAELALRQARNPRAADQAPFGLHLDVFAFEGSFLSLVLDLPQTALRGLSRRHLVRLDMICELETPLKIFARLNVGHGPNTDRIVRALPLGAPGAAVEFDLAYARIDETRLDRAWLDLIFEAPQMNRVSLRDVTLSRRLRADF